MEVPESSERTGDFVPTSYFLCPPVYNFTEIPDRHVVPRSKLSHRLSQLKRESSEQIGDVVPTSYANFPPFRKFTELHDSEEMRMINQARLGNLLRRKITRRLRGEGGPYSSADSSDGKKFATSDIGTSLFGGPRPPVKLQMHEEHRVIRLDFIYIFHPIQASTAGFLEVHTNGFIYRASHCSPIVIMNANVQGCFVRLGDYEFFPLLLFHLKHPVMIEGGKETMDIQFRLNQIHPVVQEENNVLKNFVQQVCESYWQGGWSTVPITPIEFEALGECEFVGYFPSGEKGIFDLTYSSLVDLSKLSFMVFPLQRIEIVNLALARPEIIDMTVKFEDVEDVLEIQSISSKFLTSIKHRLNFAQVKYYVNSETRDWNLAMRKIFESPEAFIHETSRLEDSGTLAYYPDADPGSDSEFLEKYGSVQL